MQKCLLTQKEDTNKVNTYYQLARALERTNPPEGALFANKALTLAEEIGFEIGIDKSLLELGVCYYIGSNFDSALIYANQLLKIRKAAGNKNSDVYRLLGNIYYSKSDLEQALQNYFASLKAAEEQNDITSQGSAWTGIGNVYHQQKNLDKALDAHQKGLDLLLQTGDKIRIGKSYNNIGNIYLAKEDYQKATAYYEKSLAMKEETQDEMGMAMTIGNMMAIALQFDHDTTKAYELCMRSIAIRKKISDKQGLCMNYINVSAIYQGWKKLETAIIYADSALQIAKEIGYKTGISNAYETMAHSYSNKGDYEKAYYFHTLYSVMKDSVLSVENSQQINEMNAKYESAKKDKQLLQKDAEAKQSSLVRNGFIIGFSLTLAQAFFIFRGYRQKQKANVIILQQKDEMEFAKLIIEEKNKDITDSINYARHIQQSLMPTEKYIEKTLKRLKKK